MFGGGLLCHGVKLHIDATVAWTWRKSRGKRGNAQEYFPTLVKALWSHRLKVLPSILAWNLVAFKLYWSGGWHLRNLQIRSVHPLRLRNEYFWRDFEREWWFKKESLEPVWHPNEQSPFIQYCKKIKVEIWPMKFCLTWKNPHVFNRQLNGEPTIWRTNPF